MEGCRNARLLPPHGALDAPRSANGFVETPKVTGWVVHAWIPFLTRADFGGRSPYRCVGTVHGTSDIGSDYNDLEDSGRFAD